MALLQTELKSHRCRGLSFLSILNAAALVITILFWGLVFFSKAVLWPGHSTELPERANAAVTYGFMIGDVLYAVPLLLLACLGIWRLKSWGWMAAQMANVLWIYSLTVILFRDAYTTISPGSLVFLPFALIAFWAIPYLWIRRKDFGIE
ncbi:MAG: hypothetical protein JW787_02635 [Sedimentisphaerales bacterium]|nr:hypothetical protein [Sedimentisphaerales bacterium]